MTRQMLEEQDDVGEVAIVNAAKALLEDDAAAAAVRELTLAGAYDTAQAAREAGAAATRLTRMAAPPRLPSILGLCPGSQHQGAWRRRQPLREPLRRDRTTGRRLTPGAGIALFAMPRVIRTSCWPKALR